MSDRTWNRDTFDVLLEDGTEFLAVQVSYGDRIAWAKFAAERNESGAGVWQVDTGGTLWCALRRQGLIARSFTWPSFWPQLAEWEKVATTAVDPTAQASGSDSPAS